MRFLFLAQTYQVVNLMLFYILVYLHTIEIIIIDKSELLKLGILKK